jgi:heterotetrameric sarcosine oxidase gamma subunit
MTLFRPSLHSPLPVQALYQRASSPADTPYLRLSDASAEGKITVEGAEAAAVLAEAWGVRGLAVTAGAGVPGGQVYCLRPDLFFVHTEPDAVATALDTLIAAVARCGAFVTVTDVTHGRAGIRVQGPGSAELLARLCGLDFRPTAFPDGTARFGSLANTRQLLIRNDRDGMLTYVVFGPRSLGAYVWEMMVAATREG